MYYELSEFDRDNRCFGDYNVVKTRANDLIKENDLTGFEAWVLYKNFNGYILCSVYKNNILLENSWKEFDQILKDTPSHMKSDSILEPFSTKKIKSVKLIQRLWRRARYNPEYSLCRKWCNRIQSTYYT